MCRRGIVCVDEKGARLLPRRGYLAGWIKKKAPTRISSCTSTYRHRYRHATHCLQEATRRELVVSYQVTLRFVTPPQYSLASVFCSTDNIITCYFFVNIKINLFSPPPNSLIRKIASSNAVRIKRTENLVIKAFRSLLAGVCGN